MEKKQETCNWGFLICGMKWGVLFFKKLAHFDCNSETWRGGGRRWGNSAVTVVVVVIVLVIYPLSFFSSFFFFSYFQKLTSSLYFPFVVPREGFWCNWSVGGSGMRSISQGMLLVCQAFVHLIISYIPLLLSILFCFLAQDSWELVYNFIHAWITMFFSTLPLWPFFLFDFGVKSTFNIESTYRMH